MFEAHITYHRNYAPALTTVLERGELRGWKFSQIHGDPLLGKDVFCYLTSHGETAADLMRRMDDAAGLMASKGVPALRKKLEQIIYDERLT